MPSNFFGHSKRALELLISVRLSPLVTFYDHWVDTITPGKKTRACDLYSGKKWKIPRFCSQQLEASTVGFSDTLNLMYDFQSLTLEGFAPFFQKSGKSCQICSFRWVTLNLVKLMYSNQHNKPIFLYIYWYQHF